MVYFFSNFDMGEHNQAISMFTSLIGIIYSIGGADYGSVRVGAFMGRKMIKSVASELLSLSPSSANPSQQMDGIHSDEFEEDSRELLEAEASLDYLCNLPPHR